MRQSLDETHVLLKPKFRCRCIYALYTFIFIIQIQTPDPVPCPLLYFLPRSRQLQRHWFAPQPKRNERHPSSNRSTDTCNPRPSSADDPTPWPLIVRKMTDGDGVLLLDVGEERSLVVDLEVEDAVLIWKLEACSVDGGGFGGACDFQGETVEW